MDGLDHAHFALVPDTRQHWIHVLLAVYGKVLPGLASVEQDLGYDAQKLGQNLLVLPDLLELLVRQQDAELGNDPLVVDEGRLYLERTHQDHDDPRKELVLQVQLHATVVTELLDHLENLSDQNLTHLHVDLDPFYRFYYRIEYLPYHSHDECIRSLYLSDLVLEEVHRKPVLVDYVLVLRLHDIRLYVKFFLCILFVK